MSIFLQEGHQTPTQDHAKTIVLEQWGRSLVLSDRISDHALKMSVINNASVFVPIMGQPNGIISAEEPLADRTCLIFTVEGSANGAFWVGPLNYIAGG